MVNASLKITFASLVLLVIGIFTSISLSAVHHVLLVLGIALFISHDPKGYWRSLMERKQALIPLFTFIVAIILSVVMNWGELENPFKNLSKIKYFLIPLLSTPLLNYLFKNYLDDKKTKILIYLFLAATTIATISGIVGLYSGFNPLKFKASCHPTRACGLYGMYMTYGYGISFFTVLLTGAIIYVKELKGFLSLKILIPIWLINFAGVVLSYARGGLLGFLVSLPFFTIKKDAIKFLLICLFILTSLGSSILLSTKLQNMFFNRSDSNLQRISFYKTAIKATQERPVFGWGYKNFEPNMTALKKKYNIAYPNYGADAHNVFLEILASTGILGLLTFIYFFLHWLITVYRNSSLIHRMSFPFVISLAVSGQVQNIFGDGENLFLIMFIWSIMTSLSVKKEVTA